MFSKLNSLFPESHENDCGGSSSLSIEPTPIGRFHLDVPLPPDVTIHDAFGPSSSPRTVQSKTHHEDASMQPVSSSSSSTNCGQVLSRATSTSSAMSLVESGSKRSRSMSFGETEPDSAESMSPAQPGARYREYQSDQWMERFAELQSYKLKHGNCCVPHSYPENAKLAKWVKRQRYQYTLKRKQAHTKQGKLRTPESTQTGRKNKLTNMYHIWYIFI